MSSTENSSVSEWDDSAATWDQDEIVRAYSEKVFTSLIQVVNPNESRFILDFGCGTVYTFCFYFFFFSFIYFYFA